MKRCLLLAKQGELYTAPNPMVGCVIVHNQKIVSEGYHQKYGDDHAEVNAFKNLPSNISPKTCTVYISLEPCSHFGKTPPCADMLAQMQPRQVIVGMLDPNPKVAGKGIKKLMESGINVKVGVQESACKERNKKFRKYQLLRLPFVTLKWAETNNGFIGVQNKSIKISDGCNDAFVHHLRATHQAILVGSKTINTDNPALDVRHVEGQNPLKIVLSENLKVDLESNLFATGYTLVYNTLETRKTPNYELVQLKNVHIKTILNDLYSRGIQSVLVEGGAHILKQFLEEKAWDEAVILVSDQERKTGIKAPWVGIRSTREERSGNDTIKYFYNH